MRTNLKPGKYIIQTWIKWHTSWNYQKYVGSSYGSSGGYNVSVDNYVPDTANHEGTDMLMKEVEIKPTQSIVKENLDKNWH